MKINNLTLLLLFSIILSSCIKEEAPNSEADILTVSISDTVMQKVSPTVENRKITFWIKSDQKVTHLAPEFTLTPGAVISPPSGTVRDFTKSQVYTVISEDGQWKKDYRVVFSKSKLAPRFTFNNYEINPDGDNKYYTFYEQDENGEKYYPWASANSAFALSVGSDGEADDYPTAVGNGLNGKALKLTTKDTGFFGNLLQKPIAAGSLFLGTFDTNTALSNPLKSVHMGIPFDKEPESLFFRYKYKSGDTYVEVIDKKVVKTPGGVKTDKFDIYAVLFENKMDGIDVHLDGTNKLTHPNIIAYAKMEEKDAIESDIWRELTIPFIFKEGKTIDPVKLVDEAYSISVVMSSSAKGDDFSGALESTLLVDELELIVKK